MRICNTNLNSMRKLYFILFSFLSFTAAAQSYELKPFYETITTKTMIKRAADFDLKGSIRSVKETLYKIQNDDPKDEDTIILTRYHFTTDGLLDSLSKGDTLEHGFSNSRAYYETYHYDEKSRRLKKLTVYDGGYYAHILTKTFNAEGFLIKERFDARFREDSELFDYTATYTYAKKFSVLDIHYAYDRPTVQYDRRDDGTWTFTFNNAGLLTGEVHKEPDFGSSTTISYHPKWNLVTGISYIERCATLNSCLVLIKGISYDDKGRKAGETLSDHTIRNSMWNYNYCYQYEYNDSGKLVKQITCSPNKQSLIFKPANLQTRSAPPKVKPLPAPFNAFEFVYDAYGNWVEKKEYAVDVYKKKALVSVIKREMAYW